MVKTKTRKHRKLKKRIKSRKRHKSRKQHKLKKRRKSRKRIKTRRRRKLKYRGGGKNGSLALRDIYNDELICHIIKLIESIPGSSWSTTKRELKRLKKAEMPEDWDEEEDGDWAKLQKIRQDEILWKEAGVNKLRDFGRLWADKFWYDICSDKDEYKNRKPPRPP
jgi:hypothetical protein